LRALVGRNVDAGMQREPAGTGRPVRIALQALQPGWHRLQCEQLLPGSWANGNTVGDRRAQQIIKRAAFAIPGEPGVLDVALDQSPSLQHTADAGRDLLDQRLRFAPEHAFELITRHATYKRRGPVIEGTDVILDDNGTAHEVRIEGFCNTY